jgi:hypothetical protein
MKLLKISFAVLLFSFLGGMQNQLFAQGPEGSWTATFNVGDSLVNGNFKAKIIDFTNTVELYVYNNDKVFCTYFIFDYSVAGRANKFKSLSFKKDRDGDIGFSRDFMPIRESIEWIALKHRKGKLNQNSYAGYVENDTVEVTESAYIQLETDGQLKMYSGTGGVPIVSLSCKRI